MKKRTISVLLLGLACHAGMAQKPQRDTLSLTSKIQDGRGGSDRRTP